MSWLGNFVSSIVDFIKGLWDKLGFLLIIAIIIFVVCAPYLVTVLGTGTAFAASLPAWLAWLPAVVTGFAEFGPLVCAVAGLGLAYLVDPADTANLVTGIADTVGDVVGTVAGSTVSAFTTASGLSQWLLLGGACVLGYFLLKSDDTDDKDEQARDASSTSTTPVYTGSTSTMGVRAS